MKLYNMNLSNFASKCRLVIYEKGAPVDIVPIPGGDLKSPAYLKIYSLGKTPALEVNGEIIGESEVINEYLEDKFPDKPLLPKDAEGRARARGVSRFHDLYVEPPLRALFPQVTAAQKDQKLIADKLAEVATRLDQLEGMLAPAGPYVLGNAFTLADCALAPTIFFANLLLPMLGAPSFSEGRPKLAAWWGKVQERPSVQKVLAEQQEALIQMQQQRR
ncbi:MAG: glutathione S-transferase family protein [Deltaproteobacteria bacterium]|nr:glutathione S-transferase family protein [Deltaproteobacteria bacterium]